MVYLTVASGGLVAGLDAGLIYNTFPKMGEQWIPEEILRLVPLYKNFLENDTTVQFQHRYLGITTFSTIGLMYYLSLTRYLFSYIWLGNRE